MCPNRHNDALILLSVVVKLRRSVGAKLEPTPYWPDSSAVDLFVLAHKLF